VQVLFWEVSRAGAPPFVFFEGWDSTTAERLGFSLISRNLNPTFFHHKRPVSTITDI
jgi:hypothetical protein